LIRLRDGGSLEIGEELNSQGELVLNGGAVHLDGGTIELHGGDIRLQGGQFLFENGTLKNFQQFDGNLLQTGGRVELGPHMQAHITGTYYQDDDATLQVALVPQNSQERLVVSGASLLGGTLEVTIDEHLLLPTMAYPFGGFFAMLRSQQGILGSFENYVLPELAAGLAWSVVQSPTDLALQIIAGDYNGDGTVGAADYTLWRDMLGQQVAPGSGADGNRNGFIDDGDFSMWKSFFGRVVVGRTEIGDAGALGGAAGVDTAAVPEPASCILLLEGLIALTVCRRRGS